jgi:hypothetical protein
MTSSRLPGAPLRDGRRFLKLALPIFIAAALLGSSVGAANAGTAKSAYGYLTTGGYQYQNYALISTNTQFHYATAWTTSKRTTGNTTPVGWAGSRGRLFTSGGAMWCEGTTLYNTGTVGWAADASSCTANATGAWYSYGVAYGWHGSGYTAYYTFLSPNQNS